MSVRDAFTRGSSSSSAVQPSWRAVMEAGLGGSSDVTFIASMAADGFKGLQAKLDSDATVPARDRPILKRELSDWESTFRSFLVPDVLRALKDAAAISVSELEQALLWFYFHGRDAQPGNLVWTKIVAVEFLKWISAFEATCRQTQVSPQQALQTTLSRRRTSTSERPVSLPPCYDVAMGLTPTSSTSFASPTAPFAPSAVFSRQMDTLPEQDEDDDAFDASNASPTITLRSVRNMPTASSGPGFDVNARLREMQSLLPEVTPSTPTSGKMRPQSFFSNLMRNMRNLVGSGSTSSSNGTSVHTPVSDTEIDLSSDFNIYRPIPFTALHSSSPRLDSGLNAQGVQNLTLAKHWGETLHPMLQVRSGERLFKPEQVETQRYRYLAEDGSGDQLSVGFNLSDIVMMEAGPKTYVRGSEADLSSVVAHHCEGLIYRR